MKALVITPGVEGVQLIDVPEPQRPRSDQVLARVLEVGICGTDREQVRGGRALAPPGQARLTVGHEALVEVMVSNVDGLSPGTLAVPTVRRGCGACEPCALSRADFCTTGRFVERGIWGLDGFQAERIVEDAQHLVAVPHALRHCAVLTEPLSIVEKALDELVRLQRARLPKSPAASAFFEGRQCLVAGLGPVGLLAALALRLRGADVVGIDVVDEQSARPSALRSLGGRYVNGRTTSPAQLVEAHGGFDVIVEAAGVASLAFHLMEALGPNGAYAATGIPGPASDIALPAAELLKRLVLRNQLLLGSVNAAREHFELAIADLQRAQLRYPGFAEQLITSRVSPDRAREALTTAAPEEIKVAVQWSPG